MRKLKPIIKRPPSTKRDNLSKDTKCHLDPDIRKEVLDEEREAIFGQCATAQSHLSRKDKEVREKDLFLFFGRFHKLRINNNGELEFDRDKPDLHIIFGYLQVGKIIHIEKATEEEKEWMKSQRHPHINYPDEECKIKCKFKECNNTIYVAGESLSINGLNVCLNGLNVPGSGVLHCSEDGVLTHKNSEKYISKWKLLPKCFKNEGNFSYHNKDSWHDEGGNFKYFKSAAIGQEFVLLEADNEAKEWAKKIICAGITHK
jgi:hypothetical protein